MKTNKFIKNNNRLYIKPEGVEYNIETGSVYRLKYDEFTGESYLTEEDNFELPNVIFENEGDTKFIQRCIQTYNNTNTKNIGILCSGLKGSGKTLMAKRIAVASSLPIIVVDPSYDTSEIESFFTKLSGQYCIILDEVEKNFNSRYLLGFLDGAQLTCKTLVICTCNDISDLNAYLLDRCSRIRYHCKFNKLDKDIIYNVFKEKLNNKDKVGEATEFAYNNLSVVSFDNIIVFAEEINLFPEYSFEEIMNNLNLSKK